MSVTAATQLFGVIGDPVRHSLSPVMHNGWFEDHGIDAVYVALPLKSEDPAGAIRSLGAFGVRGANVTVPYKEAAARAAGSELSAVNVLSWDETGRISSINTDGLGFLQALSEAAPDWRLRVKRVLIVGSGGAGAGIAQAIAPYVDTVHIANRTPSRAEGVAITIQNGRSLRWEDLERGFGGADLIVQATTLGMGGEPAPDWPIALCRPSAIVADIVYRPLETGLLAAARRRGLATVDGLGMLIHQGALSFEHWIGVKPDAAKARARLLAALGA